MTRAWALALAGLAVLVPWGCVATANGDLCSSAAFQDAFREGQDAADFPSVGASLLKLGDAAVPCLETVANDGGASLGIERCQPDPRKCRSWAILALTSIGTPAAEHVLSRLLETRHDAVETAQVVGGVTSLRVEDALPGIRRLLTHRSPYVRASAVLALGQFGQRRDFDAMCMASRSLPWENMNPAIRGLELLGDPRAIDVLEELAKKFPQPSLQAEIARTIERIRTGKGIRPTGSR